MSLQARILVLVLVSILASGVIAEAAEISVSFAQEGFLKEPFDVSKPVAYNVNLAGISQAMRYDVSLTFGPDFNDKAISTTITKPLNAKPVALNVAQFEFNFMDFVDPQFKQGEFGRWLADPSQTEPWNMTWWKVSATPLVPLYKDIIGSDYSGHPELVKFVWKLRDARVIPSEGTNDENFTYEVQLFSTAPDSLKLEVAPLREGNWTPIDERSYTSLRNWQTLTWRNVSLPFEFGAAAYRFTGRKQQTFEGPFWPVALKATNASVSPLWGTPEQRFAYALDLNASRPIDLIVNILDVGTGKYIPGERRSYSNASVWETLEWKDVRVTAQEEARGASSYYFSFHYPGSEVSFNSTKAIAGRYFPGPNISDINISGSVDPLNGTVYTPFTYTAVVDARKPASLVLEIQLPNSTRWIWQDRQYFSSGHSVLIWPNLSFRESPDALGPCKYHFMQGDNVLQEGSGPEIDVAVRNELAIREGPGLYNYTAEVRSIHPQVEMELQYSEDEVTWTRSGLTRMYNRTEAMKSNPDGWMTLVWKDQPWHYVARVDQARRE